MPEHVCRYLSVPPVQWHKGLLYIPGVNCSANQYMHTLLYSPPVPSPEEETGSAFQDLSPPLCWYVTPPTYGASTSDNRGPAPATLPPLRLAPALPLPHLP